MLFIQKIFSLLSQGYARHITFGMLWNRSQYILQMFMVMVHCVVLTLIILCCITHHHHFKYRSFNIDNETRSYERKLYFAKTMEVLKARLKFWEGFQLLRISNVESLTHIDIICLKNQQLKDDIQSQEEVKTIRLDLLFRSRLIKIKAQDVVKGYRLKDSKHKPCHLQWGHHEILITLSVTALRLALH